ncbi:glycosyltransferase 87 family protein [Propionicimonas sp.]|uniref:glycosyltransferase 87 family protein n=1 Tax=Propionicimonas sp. TaxID=1955623 RepID=UPI0039E3446C
MSWQLVAMVAVTVLAAWLSYELRSPCFGGYSKALSFSAARGCDSDLQVMWFERGLREHVLPYLNLLPSVDSSPVTVEYPVLTGLLMWVLSLPATSFAGFVAMTAVAMGALACVLTVVLYRFAGPRAWAWVAAPALVFYLTYNVDLPPVVCMVGALALVVGQDPRTVSRPRYLGAALLLALGGALKLFPLVLGPALVVWLVVGRPGPRQTPFRQRLRRSLEAVAAAVALLVAVNLPVALASPEGWLAPLTYQASRTITQDTMSIWYFLSTWVDLPQRTLMTLATLATAAGLAAVLAVAGRLSRRLGEFPLLGSSLALLAAYLLLNKVFSPQYTLWILPLLVLVGFRTWVTLSVVVVDVALYWSWHFLVLASVTWNLPAYTPWRLLNEATISARGWLVGASAVVALLACARSRFPVALFLHETSPLRGGPRPRRPRPAPVPGLRPAPGAVPVEAAPKVLVGAGPRTD